MVRREGTRFGVSTGHNVRRQTVPYSRLHAQQTIFVDTKINAGGADRYLRNEAKCAMKGQLQMGSFDTKDETPSHHMRYSLNKAKRWEVIESIKEDNDHQRPNRDIVTEHHILSGSPHGGIVHRSCVGVFDSSAEKVKRSPKKRYANMTGLMKREEMVNEKENDADFGKKNRRRSRKRRSNQEEDEEESRPLATFWYDVALAAPRQTYMTYQSTSKCTDGGKKNRNSRNRTKKLDQCNMRDVIHHANFWDEDEDYLEEDEELYWLEETKDAAPHQICMVSMETLITKQASATNTSVKDVQSPSSNTKDRVFHMDESESAAYLAQIEEINSPKEINSAKKRRRQRKKANKNNSAGNQEVKVHQEPMEVPTPISFKNSGIVVSVDSNDIAEDVLKGRFGDCFVAGQSMPLRFAINITESVLDQLKLCEEKQDLVASMRATGHSIFTVFNCMLDPRLSMRNDNTRTEEVTLKISGVDEKYLQDALTAPDTTEISRLVSDISQTVSALPSNSFPIESSVSSVAIKPSLVVDTVHSTLGWSYEVTNVNRATEKVLRYSDAQGGETGALVPSSACNACESCSICYQELDETCPGTALQGCSHWFCDTCWRRHLVARIERGDIHITCPEFECSTAVDKVTVMSLLPSKYYLRHHSNQANTALQRQPELQWCPSPRCGRLLQLANREATSREGSVVPVNCECGMFWCSQCKAEAHWPATCQQAKIYREMAKHLFAPKKDFVLVYTKRCPQCRYPIEKSYGCPHMICKCGYQFCWGCGQKFGDSHYGCLKDEWKYKRFVIRDEEVVAKSALELAAGHHRKRTPAACHKRSRRAKKIASKMVCTEDADDAASNSTATSSVSMATGDGRTSPRNQAAKSSLLDAANFLSECEFVLEHLEILLSNAPHSSQKQVVSQHKTRLLFITDQLHRILNEEVKLDMAKFLHLLQCGKSCLRWIAVAATRISNNMRSAATEE